MAQYGLLIDATKCTGCHACSIACSQYNELEEEVDYNRLEFVERGSFPNCAMDIVPVQCMHCDDAPCVNVCSTMATFQQEDGIVGFDPQKCTGCKACMAACPYDARALNEARLAEKCRWCPEMLQQGKQPVCSSTCMNEVRLFGDLEDPDSEINQKMAKHEVEQLRPDMGTKPRIWYIKK
ncbi:respiratory selenite reductase subunit SrrB [Salisediminibacterium halotolerans]|uniref:respiratory selenite reductase subunit SrrB n=1 Tax=Salisediminibacterium halotolerans TaxID=517425 RepID=UPI000EB2590B|nr:respiratory selenite reductase subunit SrrB [Salisediminibacterium halotolerans]RLJ81072.1 [NiFe]-hydrogenase II apoprotein ferredoxin-type subunit [Actinophytocola xinjiangensis]RPE84119.1 [NiFe]-hydrogenase II apoprotein ferredoxin-type subunit [Salisediminibacterium halotolerans]TWG38499.1 [NiFe]-hydrogenase II apoprotein ferredoxin-type subunit [Salisediminibacterium halotolerans]GEL08669.1 4Fe-4S ferredoxin [Salisediminibacterium halotolerans]